MEEEQCSKNKPERRGAPENYRFGTITDQEPQELKVPEVPEVLKALTERKAPGEAEAHAEAAEPGERWLEAVEARLEPYPPAAEAPRAVLVAHFPERPFLRPDGYHPASCDFRRPSSGPSPASSSL